MSADPLFSEHWYRIRSLKPALATDVEVARHIYRLQPYYILRRASTRNWHRLPASAYELVARFNGRSSVQEIWEFCLAQQGENAPGQGEFITLVGQLHEADLLIVDTRLDTDDLLGRKDRIRDRESQQRWWNPLCLRFRLFDPNSLVNRVNRWIPQRCFSALCAVTILLWCAALFTLIPQWAEFQRLISDTQVFNPVNLMVMGAVYPVMKLIHELSHALVVKRYGGDVREFGIALLVLLPNPYVDASSANFFANKHHRMLVSAAGIIVELSLAAIATLVWFNTTGTVQNAALSVMLIGCVSTLLFNGNPLLKFDGYYLLADWLEIPNLASRSRQYLLGQFSEILGFEYSTAVTVSDRREKMWLILYGILSSVYRTALMFFIAWVISGQYFFFGGLLALYVGFSSLLKPMWKAVFFVKKQKVGARLRALFLGTALATVLTGTAVALPLPKVTLSDGIVWLPDQAVIRIDQECEVSKVHVKPGSDVKAGTPLFDCVDSQWRAEVKVLEAELKRLDAERTGLLVEDPVKHQRVMSVRESIVSRYELAVEKLAHMQVKAHSDGQFLLDGNTDLEGRYLPPNKIAAYVVPDDRRTIRVALTQSDAVWVDQVDQQVDILLPGNFDSEKIFKSYITRKTPKANYQVATPALTTIGGGAIPAKPVINGVEVTEPVFDLELAWPELASRQAIGSRVRVRFDQGSATLLERVNVMLKQLILSRDLL